MRRISNKYVSTLILSSADNAACARYGTTPPPIDVPSPLPLSHHVPIAARRPTLPASPPSSNEDEDQGTSTYYTAHGRFVGDVAAAIDSRTGVTTASHRVPFVDAPLFGDLQLDHSREEPCVVKLPPRKEADALVEVYWRYMDPIEWVLDREMFNHAYNLTYSGREVQSAAGQKVWLSTLNIVFALATQRQEKIPFRRRDAQASVFFRRAWALVPAESMLWQPASIELVQCLILMNRYLHCTDNQQKTWMTAGLAILTAQSMCFTPQRPGPDEERYRQLKQRVWATCVGLDRYVRSLPRRLLMIGVSRGRWDARRRRRSSRRRAARSAYLAIDANT